MSRPKKFDQKTVLEKALGVFWRQGYAATSVDDLLRHMQINKGSMYNTFGDKRALFLKAIEHYTERYVSQKVTLLDHEPSGKKSIEQYFQKILEESVPTKKCFGCFLVNSLAELGAHDSEVAQRAVAEIDKVEDAIYRAVKRGQQAGEISKRLQPRAMARFLSNNVNGLRLLAKTSPEMRVLKDIVKGVLSVLHP